MRAAAHHMVRNMTAGMALITCREPLLISINSNLKTAFLSALRVSKSGLKLLPGPVAMDALPFSFDAPRNGCFNAISGNVIE